MSSNLGQNMTIKDTKKQVRQKVRLCLKLLDEAKMKVESAQMSALILPSAIFSENKALGIYLHCPRLKEVDTSDILSAAMSQGKTCFVPVVQDKSANMKLLHLDDMACLVSVPPFGILEPTDAYANGKPRLEVFETQQQLDVLFMPGLAFDRSGRRLGRGGGYYDKCISRLEQQAAAAGVPPPLLVALAFKAQMLDEIPVDEHDRGMDIIVTADEMLACSERGRSVLQAG